MLNRHTLFALYSYLIYLCVEVKQINIKVMSTERKSTLANIMRRSWMLVKKYGFTMAEAMKQSWAIAKLQKAMRKGIVKFIYTKLDNTVRTAWGTLQESLLPASAGTGRKPNETLVTYYDTEKGSYRSFKAANFIKVISL